MEYSIEERIEKIMNACLTQKETNAYTIFKTIAKQDYVRIHGPEHHVLDGASFLTAFYIAGGKINLEESLKELAKRGLSMPGATCGMWGVCGAASSIGAALSIIDGTGPLTTNETWSKHMEFTSSLLHKYSSIGGPRCCKRHGQLALIEAVKYANRNYSMHMEEPIIKCEFHDENTQCVQNRCPFR